MPKHILITLGLTFFLSACASQPVSVNEEQNALEPMPVAVHHTIYEPVGEISHIIPFDFSSSTLSDVTRLMIQPHAEYLIINPYQVASLQGSADEKGNSDFNFHLGLSRAEAVKSYLLFLGVDESQILISSVGEHGVHFESQRHVVISY